MQEADQTFYLAEYESLRSEIARIQVMRAQFERLALAAIFIVWSFAATKSVAEKYVYMSIFIWLVPVFIALIARERLKLFHRGIRLCGDYLCLIYPNLANSDVPGWEVWLRKETRGKGNDIGTGRSIAGLWDALIGLTIIVAVVAIIIELLNLLSKVTP